MLRLGLTGGIGAGKSTVSARLAEHGAVVIDADSIAREVVEPGTDGLEAIVAEFGDEVLGEHGRLDRPKLGKKVFADEQARARLSGILHPRIGARTAELMEDAAEDAIVVHDVPLLVENDLAPAYHLVLVVHAAESERIERLRRTRGMGEDEARDRIRAQADDASRMEVADVWLDNGDAPDTTLRAVDALWADRLVGFEANLRLRRTSGPAAPRIVEYDQRWPAEARRLARRITAALGEYPVQHVGSTAIEGLGGKDVIDLQLLVPDLATADGLAEALGAAGFPLCPGSWWDNTNPIGGRLEKRLHGCADPGRPVNLHVRVQDGQAAEFALLFRDWLRDDADARAEYLARKRELASVHATTQEYAAAKEPWFDKAHDRAWAWARRTGWTPPVH